MTEWKLNDFGMGEDFELRHSHGCLHVQPADRERLMTAGYMQNGVRVVIKKYDEALDMQASNQKE